MTHKLGMISREIIVMAIAQPRLSIGFGGLGAVGLAGVLAHLVQTPF